MNKEKETEKENSYIKLTRGQRGGYGWDIKVVNDDMNIIIQELKRVDQELIKSFNGEDNDNNK